MIELCTQLTPKKSATILLLNRTVGSKSHCSRPNRLTPMFREIYFLRSEDVSMELSSPMAMRLSKVPHKGATAASLADMTTECSPTWGAASSPSTSGCELIEAAENREVKKLHRRPGSTKVAPSGRMSIPELLTDVSFCVYSGVHLFALYSAFTWFSWRLVGLAAVLYAVRMFGITGGYHRLLSHRSYRTSRIGQFVMAALGCLAFQKGPIWWCSHHRHHHRTADTAEDAHSPLQWGIWWSHVGWFLCTTAHAEPLWSAVPDLLRFPELVWMDRYHYVFPGASSALLYWSGGIPAVGWGFAISTVACWHATYCINSLAHLVGSRRFRCEFNTHCDARNNWWLAILTLGEGWHNNHHCYMRSARHGFYPREVDVTWYVLLVLERMGLVWQLEVPPLATLIKMRFDDAHLKCRCALVQSDLKDLCQSS